LQKAHEAQEIARADSLLDQVKFYLDRVDNITAKAEAAGDLRTALNGLREARGYVELLAKLLGELDERPEVNLHVAPEWIELRAMIVGALGAYPSARQAVLEAIEGGDG
jgi:hypothetical protein